MDAVYIYELSKVFAWCSFFFAIGAAFLVLISGYAYRAWTRRDRLSVDVDVLLDDLRLAAETLRRYEQAHRAKGAPEADAKAEVNALLAARFEATIAKVDGDDE